MFLILTPAFEHDTEMITKLGGEHHVVAQKLSFGNGK